MSFDARHIDGSNKLTISRPWGGANPVTLRLIKDWRSYSKILQGTVNSSTESVLFALTDPPYASNGTCEIDNVVIQELDKNDNPTGENLAKNGTFDQDLNGWGAHTMTLTEARKK